MCCRRRGQRAPHTPVLVTLCKMAYIKYQQHHAEKLAIARSSSPDPNYGRIEYANLPGQANSEILEKAGISPPSYNDVVTAERAVMPPEPNPSQTGKEGWVSIDGEEKLYRSKTLDSDELCDADSFYDVSDGVAVPNVQPEAAQASFVEKWKSRREEKQARRERMELEWQLKREEKRAAKAARRVEKRARCGSCCG